ncbi:hypothetical protein CDAR_608931 [Caerostris darwini]|uniref:Uncharacterized protein n=1 Tax=Caerostris darwini TaxID=1538125 RepID=A0AAV4WLT3_9ARAC|nr:hypothetical protein CDAR_608931 [Caerostris darwini]
MCLLPFRFPNRRQIQASDERSTRLDCEKVNPIPNSPPPPHTPRPPFFSQSVASFSKSVPIPVGNYLFITLPPLALSLWLSYNAELREYCRTFVV